MVDVFNGAKVKKYFVFKLQIFSGAGYFVVN